MSVPLENDYLHTLYFPDRDTQTEYFKSKTLHTMTNCTFQRGEGYIRFDKPIEYIIRSNYVMYQNSAHTNKWYYAFITRMEYKDDGVTLVYIERDVFQTWCFNFKVRQSFIEREHTDRDDIGLHTVPEGLELGDYIVNKSVKCGSFETSGIVLGCTVDLSKLEYVPDGWFASLVEGSPKCDPISGSLYGGVFSGVHYYYFPLYEDATTGLNGYTELELVIRCLASMGQSECIVSIFMVPENLVQYTQTGAVILQDTDPTIIIKLRSIKESYNCISHNWDASNDGGGVYKPTSLNGYIPKNNKLFTFPYCYINMSNNAGSSAIYKYELFSNGGNLCTFQINGAITPGFSARLLPLHYNGEDKNEEEGLNAGKLPICAWNTDVYTNWLTQNSINMGVSVGSSLLAIGGGVALMASGGGAAAGVGAIAGGVMGIASTMGEKYQHSFQPPQAEGNINNGDVVYATGELTFRAYQMSIKKEYARMIDNYFTMFGYKVNRMNKPLQNHREAFWFTKTIDVNIEGAIPQEDLQKVKECYNRGITFWRHTVDIRNYSQDNGII